MNEPTYTHQTQGNPPRLARFGLTYNGAYGKEVWLLKNKDATEEPLAYYGGGKFISNCDSAKDLTPIPQNPYWHKFEHIKLDAWYRSKESMSTSVQPGYRIESIDPRSPNCVEIRNNWETINYFKDKEYSLGGITWHECTVE